MSMMATEPQVVNAYVHHTTRTTEHELQVLFTELLDSETPTLGAHLEVLRHNLYRLRKLQIHVYEHKLVLIWWAPLRFYRPRHLHELEDFERAAASVAEILGSLFAWPTPPYLKYVSDLG